MYQWKPEKKPANASTLRRNPGTREGELHRDCGRGMRHGRGRGVKLRVPVQRSVASNLTRRATRLHGTGSGKQPTRPGHATVCLRSNALFSSPPRPNRMSHTDPQQPAQSAHAICESPDAPMTRSAGSICGQSTERAAVRCGASGAFILAITAAIRTPTAGGSCRVRLASRDARLDGSVFCGRGRGPGRGYYTSHITYHVVHMTFEWGAESHRKHERRL